MKTHKIRHNSKPNSVVRFGAAIFRLLFISSLAVLALVQLILHLCVMYE